MKFILVQCDEAVDITVIAKGAAVSVTDGANTLDGIVASHIDYIEPDPPSLVPHTHTVVASGNADVTGGTGPAVP